MTLLVWVSGQQPALAQRIKDRLVSPWFKAASWLEAVNHCLLMELIAQELTLHFCIPGDGGGGCRPPPLGAAERGLPEEKHVCSGEMQPQKIRRSWGSHFTGSQRPKGPAECEGPLEPDGAERPP